MLSAARKLAIRFQTSDFVTAAFYSVLTKRKLGKEMHSKPTAYDYPEFSVEALPANVDNFMYIVVDKSSKDAVVVDPVMPEIVLKRLGEMGVNVIGVLTTHHHWDHAGGNVGFVKTLGQNINVYGGDDRIGALTKKVTHGEKIPLRSNGLQFECLETPCHTTGHICYYLSGNEPGSKVVFTGDTLFIAGCGRFFEGKPEQMHRALNEILASLPGTTSVFCGHEYTVANLNFGLYVEPDNQTSRAKREWAINQRNEKKPTLPSTIDEEKQINPFMRVDQASVQQFTKTVGDSIATMKVLRAAKDNFKSKK